MDEMIFSLIIPMYNAEDSIVRTLSSIKAQTFNGKFECLLINDGSTDSTIEVVNEYITKECSDVKNIFFKVIDDGFNKKQGTRRNEGIRLANANWLFFIDADDTINPKALEVCYESIIENPHSDMIYFNYSYDASLVTKRDRRSYTPVHNNVYTGIKEVNKLIGKETYRLLNHTIYFTVNKIYKKDFLLDNNLFYGEGYYYEDIEFYVNTCIAAEEIACLPNVLYNIVLNDDSVTAVSYDTAIHTESLLKSLKKTSQIKFEVNSYPFIKYYMNRSLHYAEDRSNYNFREKIEYISKVIDVIKQSEAYKMFSVPANIARPLDYMIFSTGYFEKNAVRNMILVNKMYRYKFNRPTLSLLVKLNKFIKNKKITTTLNWLALNKARFKKSEVTTMKNQTDNKMNVIDAKVLMLGFDHKYNGNSKYLFEELSTKLDYNQLKFACVNQPKDDRKLLPAYTLTPGTKEFREYMESSSIIIAESWSGIRVADNQHYIQLWHGNPFKKLLFDSTEQEVYRWNKSHKRNKSININKWTALLTENKDMDEKFMTAFNFPTSKLQRFLQPKTKWILENKQNKELKEKTRNRLGVGSNQKMILYAPTWRDYNFRKSLSTLNTEYMLNFNNLKHELDDYEYVVVMKPHPMDKFEQHNKPDILLAPSEDIEPYVLAADIVVTDYSSVLFDAINADIPFYLLMKDYYYYKNIRGVYQKDLKNFANVSVENEIELARAIIEKRRVSEKAKTQYRPDTDQGITDFIIQLLEKESQEGKSVV